MGRQDRDWAEWGKWGAETNAELSVVSGPLMVRHTCLRCHGEGSVDHSRYDQWGIECPDCENNRVQYTAIAHCPQPVVDLAYAASVDEYGAYLEDALAVLDALKLATPHVSPEALQPLRRVLPPGRKVKGDTNA